MSTDEQMKPDPNPVLENLIWLQETREDRLAKARGEQGRQGSGPPKMSPNPGSAPPHPRSTPSPPGTPPV
ncbi:hypothetical protein [Streptomyces sp. NPDC059452]|uniref:hypothetical protein n=1 Tax=Streptomyces sp. NPDC059452 TaxID=3346835 RepID=UPI0036902338